jgi:hypothetical protein
MNATRWLHRAVLAVRDPHDQRIRQRLAHHAGLMVASDDADVRGKPFGRRGYTPIASASHDSDEDGERQETAKSSVEA